MSSRHTDTLKVCEALERAGLSHIQAKGISDFFKTHDDGYHDNFVTKSELESFGNQLLLKVAAGGVLALGLVIAVAALFLDVGEHRTSESALSSHQQPSSK